MNLLYRKAVHTMKMIIPIKICSLVKMYWGTVEMGLSIVRVRPSVSGKGLVAQFSAAHGGLFIPFYN